MADYRVVLVTAPGVDEARRLAGLCIDAGLAPCVNIIPGCVSVYAWQGRTHEDEEALMVIKTDAGSLAALTGLLERSHPYDVPEILALPLSAVAKGYEAYLDRFFEGGR